MATIAVDDLPVALHWIILPDLPALKRIGKRFKDLLYHERLNFSHFFFDTGQCAKTNGSFTQNFVLQILTYSISGRVRGL